jgi:hypothetical protein
MKFELKGIKFIEAMSEETNCFYGKLYINKKFVADVRNDGRGGCTEIVPVSKEFWDVIAEANKYLASQPKKKSDMFDFEYIRTVESEVDDLFADWLQVKEEKKLAKQMDKGILYGTKYSYRMVYWTGTTLVAMLKNPVGQARVKKILQDLTDKGETILNTNIPQEFYPTK